MEKIVFGILILIMLVSGALLTRSVVVTLPDPTVFFRSIQSNIEKLNSPTPTPTPVFIDTSVIDDIEKDQVTIPSETTVLVPTNSPILPTIQPKKNNKKIYEPCSRFTIRHLDGSTSSLCYNNADYQSLMSLSNELASAETFYQFHLDSVARYQKEYERTGSSIYLDAKASSQSDADGEKAKADQARADMSRIEQRGKP